MRVPDEVRQCVAFIGLIESVSADEERMLPRGTVFFVSIESETSNIGRYVYMVTAKHVADRIQGRNFVLRINSSEGGALFIHGGKDTKWWFHPTDTTADVAMIPWAPSPPAEYKHIPTTMFLSEEVIKEKSIGTGDEVFITGLFAHHIGSQRNIPIARMGNIAMMPNEAVPTSMGMLDAYLIEARSIGGLSGSPAFVRETVPLGTGGFHLLGLMHGHWDIPPTAKNDEAREDHEDESGSVNMGIAIVVPAKKILETIMQADLVEMRQNLDEQWRKENMPTLDEALEKQESQEQDAAFTEQDFEDAAKKVIRRTSQVESEPQSPQT